MRMNSKREDFPATSIGRTAGARLQNASLNTTGLDAHPLLSPRPASPAVLDHGSQLGNNVPPRYVPYTPRHRVTPTAATTGTTVHPTSPQHQTGDATSKLQLMHLKAAAQTIGLDGGSLGWMMLEKLVLDSEVGDEWTEIWSAITSGKATLLLPLESTFTNEKITPDFMKNHVVICDGSSRNSAPVITLSGLRGTLEEETLTFRSTVNPSSTLFQNLYNVSTRTSSLSHLPPLPLPYPEITTVSYPKFHIPSHTSSLPLPPRTHSSKPPLPPRPGIRPPVPTPSSTTAPRIGIPFVSLFSGSKAAPQPPPPSPPASLRSLDSATDSTTVVEVSAFAIDHRIIREETGKAINKALKSELKAALKASKLANVPIPHWVIERIHEFSADWYPFVSARSKNQTLNSYTTDKPTREGAQKYVVNPIEENMEDMAERLQDFFASLEQDMRVSGEPTLHKPKEKESESEAENGAQGEKRDHEKMESELKIREVMEAVERIITWLFYDRLFKQPTTDDASHDEALSNRIGALNMLDLDLGHLGIDLGGVRESDLIIVVEACGEMLGQLDVCRSPSDKAAVLVAAHKIVVDGLSRLPPIRLVSEDEADANEQDPPLTAKPLITEKIVAEAEVHLESEHPTAPNSSDLILASAEKNPASPSVVDGDTSAIAKSGSCSVDPVSKVKAPPPPLSLGSPKLQVSSPVKEPTPVSGDILFPIMIFSVVKANPPHLVSNLLFTQRFRNQSIGGEESYCLINMMAVAEFLENVDMAALGLDSDKVLSTADLTPIPLNRSPVTAEMPLSPDGTVAGLRGRVEQQVDAIADSANKVISGVVDSSFGILRSFMPNGNVQGPITASSGRTTPGTPGRTAFGLLKRESGFSIASLAASLPIAGRSRSSTNAGEEAGQQMVSVSRPSSVRLKSPKMRATLRQESEGDDDEEEEESSSSSEESGEEKAETGIQEEIEQEKKLSGDARSIRSFESMLSASRENSKRKSPVVPTGHTRKTLSDRLASVSALAASDLKGSSPVGSRRSSTLVPHQHQRSKSATSPASSSRPASPAQEPVKVRLGPPKQRFMECTPDDLRLGEIGELLRDYRRLVEGIRAVGGFEDG